MKWLRELPLWAEAKPLTLEALGLAVPIERVL
jgi:hypothetical protein